MGLQFARKGVQVLGLDVDETKVNAINRKKSYIKHIPSEDIAKVVDSEQFAASTDFSKVRKVDAVLICVPTPLDRHREPDLSYVLKSGEAIAPYLSPINGQPKKLVVLESWFEYNEFFGLSINRAEIGSNGFTAF